MPFIYKSELNSSSIGSVRIMQCFSLKDSRAAADLEKANKEKDKFQGQVEALKKAAQVRSHCFEGFLLFFILLCSIFSQTTLLRPHLIRHSGALQLLFLGQHKVDMRWKNCKGWVWE